MKSRRVAKRRVSPRRTSSCARRLSSFPRKPISRSMRWMRSGIEKASRTSPSEALAKLIAGVVLLCAAVLGWAQDYPSRTIVLVVPFTPGTTADSLARLMQPHLAQRWSVPVVVENKPGAAGMIGIDAVAKANPDGYTLLFTSTAFGTIAAMNPKLPYDPDKSFAPVILLGTSPLSLVVPKDVPANTLKEFIAHAKERPGALNYASAGTGSVVHPP